MKAMMKRTAAMTAALLLAAAGTLAFAEESAPSPTPGISETASSALASPETAAPATGVTETAAPASAETDYLVAEEKTDAPASAAPSAVPGEEAKVPVLPLPKAEGGKVVPIPVDQNSLKVAIAPREENYLYDGTNPDPTGYADPSITVNIGRGRIYDTGYVYARVKIADGSQLRTLMASPLNNKNTTYGYKLAERVKAVVAINGDFCGGEDVKKGAIMRQGKMMRLKCDGQLDVLAIDRDGNLIILPKAQNADVEALGDRLTNLFTFGPALVIDGVPQYGRNRPNLAPNKPAQRMAICQTGQLEYLLITSEGPEDPGSVGLGIDQFVDLIMTFPGVRQAYNLDGGSSSTMVFRKEGNSWRKINAPQNPKSRELKDIIYFATAYEAP